MKTKRLVFFSTAAVYARSETFPLRENEGTIGPHDSFGDYGTNKAEIETFYKNVCKQDDVKLTILRPHYILGPHDYFERHYYILSRIEQRKPLYIPGGGQALIQFAFADDVAKLFYEAPFMQKIDAEAINVAGDELITLKGFVERLGEAIGISADINLIDYAKFGLGADRFYDDLFLFPNLNLILDTQHAKKKYGYLPAKMSEYIPKLIEDWKLARSTYVPNFTEETVFGKK